MSSIPPRNIRPLQTRHRLRKSDNFGRVESQHDIDEIINFVRNRQSTSLQMLQRETTDIEMGLKRKAPLPGIGTAVPVLSGIGEERLNLSEAEPGTGTGDAAQRQQLDTTTTVHLDTVTQTLPQSDAESANSPWDIDNQDADAAYESDFDESKDDAPTADDPRCRSISPHEMSKDCRLMTGGSRPERRLYKSLDGLPSTSREPEMLLGMHRGLGERKSGGLSRSLPPVLPDRPRAPSPGHQQQQEAAGSKADVSLLPERPSAPSPSVTPPLSEDGMESPDEPIDYIDSR